MVKNDKYQKHYTYGNVAYELQPQIEHEEKIKKQPKKDTKAELKVKFKLMGLVAVLTVFSFLLLCRFAQINTLTAKIRTVKNDIKVAQKENENLEVQIARIDNIKDIESKAVGKYGMIIPDRSAIVYVDVKQLALNEDQNDKKATAYETVQRLLGLIY